MKFLLNRKAKSIMNEEKTKGGKEGERQTNGATVIHSLFGLAICFFQLIQLIMTPKSRHNLSIRCGESDKKRSKQVTKKS